MHQTLASPVTVSPATLQHANRQRTIRWTVLTGVQVLRQKAVSLRAAFLARKVLADVRGLSEEAASLLQQADMLEKGAEVLALTSKSYQLAAAL